MEEEEAMLNKEEEDDDDEEYYSTVKFEDTPRRSRTIMVEEVARRLKNGDLMMRIEAAKEVRKMVRKSSDSNSKSAVRCRFAAAGVIELLVSMLNNWFPLSAREAALFALLNLAARILRRGHGELSLIQETSGASVNGHQKAKDHYELYIEVPETATVGSLKRNVLETVTSILRGGIRVGVVLQGKKIRDNNITLRQANISQSCNLNSLGFTLEPNYTRVRPSKKPEKLPLVLPCDADQQVSRSPATPVTYSGITRASDDCPLVNKLDNVAVIDELMSLPKAPTDAQMDIIESDSQALVCVPPMNMEALPVVTLNPKHKCSELSQHRSRRPFSVQEVEAQVEAVEKLGTGRWRDIKMCAFENADHRTYVDLKDKWKTLVHTGSIAPTQRRGKPMPQELLDRVLAAH